MVIEHAPAARRGLFGSLVQIGAPLGLVTSSGVFALVTMMPEALANPLQTHQMGISEHLFG
jgi:MFS transporter, MHS family, shikimate and dehydroshikimate transport protein